MQICPGNRISEQIWIIVSRSVAAAYNRDPWIYDFEHLWMLLNQPWKKNHQIIDKLWKSSRCSTVCRQPWGIHPCKSATNLKCFREFLLKNNSCLSVSYYDSINIIMPGDGKEWDVYASVRFRMSLNVNQIYLEFLKTRTILPASQTQLPVDCLTFKIAIFILPLKCWTLNLAAVLWSNDQSPCRGLQQDWKGNS